LNGTGGMDGDVTFDEWLERCQCEPDLPFHSYDQSEKAPGVTLLVCAKDTDRLVGCVNIRPHLTKRLDELQIGNIGWSIRPSEQRKGYGKVLGRLVMAYCQSIGLETVRIGCHELNHGSRKIIESLGGQLIEERCTLAKSLYYQVKII